MFDLIIQNALIVDGTGSKPYRADVAVRNDKIENIGRLRDHKAQRTIDANGRMLTPGFIDLHSHSDLGLAFSPFEPNKISQGVTTEVAGNCGFSLFPVTPEGRPAVEKLMQAYGVKMELPWSDGAGYYTALTQRGFGVNYLPLVGHGLLRLNVMGYSAGPADKNSLPVMGNLLEAELASGAWGFSTGLAYMPGCFADYKELRYLAEITAEYGGVYTSHIRNQGNELIESVDEAIRLAEETGVSVIISHLKAYGPKNWGKAEAALERIDSARSSGYRVMADFYPYDSSESTLMYELPEWAKAGGVKDLLGRLADAEEKRRIEKELDAQGEVHWDKVLISGVQNKEDRWMIGKSIATIAEENGMRNFDVVATLLNSEQGGVSTVCRLMSQDDVDIVACAGATAVGSDAYALPEGKEFYGHPRNWGAFPHFYNLYVKQKGLLKPEQAVHKMSGMAAEFLGVPDRGYVKEGYKADLVLCDHEQLEGRADYEHPDVASGGIDLVLINGQIQFETGTLQRKTAGEILFRNRGK